MTKDWYLDNLDKMLGYVHTLEGMVSDYQIDAKKDRYDTIAHLGWKIETSLGDIENLILESVSRLDSVKDNEIESSRKTIKSGFSIVKGPTSKKQEVIYNKLCKRFNNNPDLVVAIVGEGGEIDWNEITGGPGIKTLNENGVAVLRKGPNGYENVVAFYDTSSFRSKDKTSYVYSRHILEPYFDDGWMGESFTITVPETPDLQGKLFESRKPIKSSLEDRLIPYLEEFEEGYANAITRDSEEASEFEHIYEDTFFEGFKSDYNLTDMDIRKLEKAVRSIWDAFSTEEDEIRDMGEMYGVPRGATPEEALKFFQSKQINTNKRVIKSNTEPYFYQLRDNPETNTRLGEMNCTYNLPDEEIENLYGSWFEIYDDEDLNNPIYKDAKPLSELTENDLIFVPGNTEYKLVSPSRYNYNGDIKFFG